MNNLFLKTEVEGRGDLKQPGTTQGKGESLLNSYNSLEIVFSSINHEIHFL